MQENPLVLTFDVGTQSTRAVLVDKRGDIVGIEQYRYEKPYYSLEPGWAEQDPQAYWEAICDVGTKLKAAHEDVWDDIIAVTCTCLRATTICLDKNNQPLRDAIVWLDKRTAEDLPPLPARSRFAFRIVGMTETVETIRGNLACNWIIQNEPDIWERTDKFVLLSAYLNVLFCGNLVDSTANTVGFLPFDYRKKDWMAENDLTRPLYLMESDKLYDLVEPGEIIGNITKEAAEQTGVPEGIPYVVTGADKACETLGLSCVDSSSAALSFGTIATVEVPVDTYLEVAPGTPPYISINGGYLPEIETFRGYWLISWFTKEFALKEVQEAKKLDCSPEELLNQRLKEIPPGCDGLILQPTFTPDMTTPHARGSAIGLSDIHTRIHLYRSIVEGVNFSLIEGLHLIEKKGKFKVEKLFVAGGGSRSAEICQITANMFGLPLYRTQTHEVSGIGSSMVAFVTMGVYKDYTAAIEEMVHIRDVFEPDMEEHKVYQHFYKDIYCKIFENLVPLYQRINEILLPEKSQ